MTPRILSLVLSCALVTLGAIGCESASDEGSVSVDGRDGKRDASAAESADSGVDITSHLQRDAGTDAQVHERGDASADGGPTVADAGPAEDERGLSWPIACTVGSTCQKLGYPDIDLDDKAFDCSAPGYEGHQGTDIPISWEQMDAGIDVYAAAGGEVLWVFDGKYDKCPDATEPDCADPVGASTPGRSSGYEVCTESGAYCSGGGSGCFWCFSGGNVVVIRHNDTPGVFATRYDHLKRNSILVTPGDRVKRGEKIAEVGSAGRSTGPHLHFEVWGDDFYQLADPWVGECGPNETESLWRNDPPWE